MQDYTFKPQVTRHRRRAFGAMRDVGTVLVTGATGTVGSTLVSLLAARGVAVRALSRRGLPPDAMAKGIDVAKVDLRDAQSTADALSGV